MKLLGASLRLVSISSSMAVFLCGYSLAQDYGPFTGASQSLSAYSQSWFRPTRACASMVGLDDGLMHVTSVAIVAVRDSVPEHCQVRAAIAPAIDLEIDLPTTWNGRFYMSGNGGAAGELVDEPARTRPRDRALRFGFVTASTNAGHDHKSEPFFTFAVDDQKLADYGYRAVHLTAEAAKRAAVTYYGTPVRRAYWDSCSTGGREGLMEAQRFPQDFDGLVVGAPALNFSGLLLRHLWNAHIFETTPISVAKLHLVGAALYAKCDAADGVSDGLLANPRQCKFDPARDVPACSGRAGDNCLTHAEATAFQQLYRGPTINGHSLFPGIVPGAEPATASAQSGWLTGASGFALSAYDFINSQLRDAVFRDPAYDWHHFDLQKDSNKLARLRDEVDATNPDLAGLRARNGKILMYYGGEDAVLSPDMGIQYYRAAAHANGPDTDQFFRLFLVPGMFHCGGGYGPNQYDAITALIDWVEKGKAPDRLIAAEQQPDRAITRTRPLCPYPKVARYDGRGSVDRAESFTCAASR